MARIVLILEDDPLVATVMASSIEDAFEGCTACIATSVAEAGQLAGSRVDCALLDVEVADGRSYPFAAKLQEQRIPLIFVSGTSPHAVPAELAAIPFLQKPVGMNDVLTAMRHYL
ncbi:response regulator [Reyranella sp.]|uniref:response regulator n=1 Tax=Reyranella sp. TaxID=1929291 RepID=UPI003BA9CC54